jgi:ribonuclease BN (tRNA processing enzyme)
MIIDFGSKIKVLYIYIKFPKHMRSEKMKLTVLGNYGPYPKAGGACSGFLVDSGEAKVLLDCGNGVLSRLLLYIDLQDLDAVILSHLHSDHMSDVMILRYAANVLQLKGQLKSPIKVYAPAEPLEEFERLRFNNAIELIEIKDTSKLNIKNLNIRFKEVEHGYKNYAVSLEQGSKKFVYSGDTNSIEELMNFSKGADLLLCEAGLLERDEKCIRAMHLTAKEAGEVATMAGVKRLLLTHFLPDIKVENYMREASSVYSGIMEIAGENKSYFI